MLRKEEKTLDQETKLGTPAVPGHFLNLSVVISSIPVCDQFLIVISLVMSLWVCAGTWEDESVQYH